MLDKQKLLTWIEDKKYVYEVPDEYGDSKEELAEWKGCMKVLNIIKWQIERGEFVVDNGRK